MLFWTSCHVRNSYLEEEHPVSLGKVYGITGICEHTRVLKQALKRLIIINAL